MDQRRREFVIGCEVIGLYALVTLPMLLRYPPIWPDEVLFMSPADSLARGHGMSTPVLAGFIPGMDRYTFWLPPGYFVALAALFRFSDPAHELLVMRLFSWLLGGVLLGLAWMILRRLISHSWMIWPGLILLATHPTFIRAANLGRMEMLTLVFAAGAAAVYLRFLEKGQGRTVAAAGLLAGLACLCHPAGIVILAALALHQSLKGGLRTLARKEIYLFLASALVPMLPWLVYILQAPEFFLIQFAGQFVRKTSAAHTFLEHGTALGWLFHPLQFAEWGRRVRSPRADLLSAFTFLLSLLLLLLPGHEKVEAWVLGLWVWLGFVLNLFTPEDWYPIYFVLPTTLVLSWGARRARYRWARALGVVTLLVGIGWNLSRASALFKSSWGGWSDYQRYASVIAAHIPPGSSVLLMATPDPYFGLQAQNKDYRLYEFVPEGIPVDPGQAEKALGAIDYVVDSGCCNPAYVREYLPRYGKLVGGAASTDHEAGPVWIWKLRRP